METRRAVVEGWSATAEALAAAGQGALATEVRRFVAQMPTPKTTDEQLAEHILKLTRTRQAPKEPPRTR
ncbi:MAG TPA: hypothetical protein VMF64_01985 [Steroidobacteraceae bacterium]|nr:hypothetical protein [Steroidobacteraceae bacterium]